MLPAGLKAHQDPVRKGLQHLRGQPRHHVGLMNHRGDASPGGGLHHGVAGIAAGADHRVRRELPQNSPGLPRRPQEVAHGDQIVPDLPGLEGAVKAGDMDGAEVVSRLGDQVLLQPPLRAHKQKRGLRVLPAHQLRQSDGRIHMPRRTAAGKNDPFQVLRQGRHPLSQSGIRSLEPMLPPRPQADEPGRLPGRRRGASPLSQPAFVGFICRETDRTIPISASWIISAVPP